MNKSTIPNTQQAQKAKKDRLSAALKANLQRRKKVEAGKKEGASCPSS